MVDETHPYGLRRLCPDCVNLLEHSRLTADEQQITFERITGPGDAAILRTAGQALVADPFGFLTVWGGPGSAKTLLLQAIVTAFCRSGRRAVYYHARDLQDGCYRDIEGDTSNLEFYKRVPVLAVDELDKWHMTDWSRTSLQALIDHRYRRMNDQVTLFASNRDPLGVNDYGQPWLPEDIRSRLLDGRFNRHWPVGQPLPAKVRLPDGVIPGIYHVTAPDVRPTLKRNQGKRQEAA